MISLDFPILFVGPAGSGKLTRARAALGVSATQEPILKFLVIGDYSARYWEFLTHIEVDVSDLSMMDKQIIPEIINQLLSSRNVRAGSRKLMILRRVHCLSPAAATRLRVCLENIVWTHEIPAIIWCTARTVNSAVASILDGFIYKRIPGPIPQMIQTELIQKFDNSLKIPTVQSYIFDMLSQMNFALLKGEPTLAAIEWIRGRIYVLLGLMITGAELVAGLTWATVRLAASGSLSTVAAKSVLDVLTRTRWVASYRTPVILELIVVSVYDAIGKSGTIPAPSAAATITI